VAFITYNNSNYDSINKTMEFYLKRNILEDSQNSSDEYYNSSELTKDKVHIHNLINFDNKSERPIKVSIIVPVCNVEEFLPECLDSCINQTLNEIEIICVNDGSSDNSLKILKEYATKDNRIKIIDKDNAGYGHTMNIGIDMASGEYIGFVESDDYIKSDMYEKLYEIAIMNDLDMIKSDFYRFTIDETGHVQKRLDRVAARAPDLYNKIVNPKKDTRVFKLVMQTWCGIYKKKFLISNNIRHNETPGASYQDNGFWFQSFMYANKVYFYNQAFYMNRRDNPNSSVYNKGKVYCMHDEYIYIKNILLKHPKLYELFKYQYTHKKFLNFLFTYKRIATQFKYEYLFSIQKEIMDAEKHSEIKWEEFDKKDRIDLKQILEDPVEFFINDIETSILSKSNIYKNQNDTLLLENKRLKNKLNRVTYERNQSNDEVNRLKNQMDIVNSEKEKCMKEMYKVFTSKSYLRYEKIFGSDKTEKDEPVNEYTNNVVHVAFITDENYAMPTTVALTSLKLNKKDTTKYFIHILANKVTEYSKSKFLMLNDENFEINIIPVKVDKKFSKLTKKDGDLHVSPSAIIKLRLPEILNKVGKVLYLDGDVLIQDDLLELYNTDIKKYYAAVVKDILSERNRAHMINLDIKNKYYFNSGMMLLNLTKCRKNNMTHKLLDYRENGKNHFMDQDTLNYVFNENVKYVSYKYNYLNKFYDWWGGERLSVFYGEIFPSTKKESFKNAVIIHFGSHEKPWLYDLGYLSQLYKKYYMKSPYKNTELRLEKLPEQDSQVLIKISDEETLSQNRLIYEYKKSKEEKDYFESEYNKLKELYKENELFVINEELKRKERDIENITNSKSFKIGKAITSIPRKFK